MKNNLFSIFLFLQLIVLTTSLSAGELTIEGKPTISITQSESQIKIEGSYEIVNKGNEIAQNVFPQIEIGKWRWAGDPQTLSPEKTHTWQINQQFAAESLKCADKSECSSAELPIAGVFAARVLRLYEDVNGHGFSAADILKIPIGDLTSEQSAQLRVPRVVQAMKCEGDGESFECKVQIKNGSTNSFIANTAQHTSRELEIQSTNAALEISANSSSSYSFNVKNFSGLPGSSYQVFSILEWQENNLRNSAIVSANVFLQEPTHSNLYLIIGIASIAILSLAVYWFIFKKS